MRFFFLASFVVLALNGLNQEMYVSKQGNFPGLARDDAIAFSIESWIYAGTGNHGGFGESNRFYKMNSSGDAFEIAPFPGTPRQYASVGVVGQSAFMVGGYSWVGDVLGDFWEFEYETESWTKLPDPPFSKRWASTTFVIDSFLFVGSGRDTLEAFNDLWRYNTHSGLWKKCENIPSAAIYETVGFEIYNRGYIGLGKDTAGNLHDEFYSYDWLTDSWSEIEPFGGGPRYYSQGVTYFGQGFVFGGQNETGEILGDLWSYDPIVESWTEINFPLKYGSFIPPRRGMSVCNYAQTHACFLFGLSDEFERSDEMWFFQVWEGGLAGASWPIDYIYESNQQVLYLKNMRPGIDFSIYDISGQLITTYTPMENSLDVDVSSLSAGQYFLRAGTGRARRWVKI